MESAGLTYITIYNYKSHFKSLRVSKLSCVCSNFLYPVMIKVINDADHISFLVVVETDISWRDVAMSEPTDTKERVRG